MQKIKSSELKTNMKFTSPVFFDDGINMFLSENNPLTENHIELIKNLNIEYVITNGKILEEEKIININDKTETPDQNKTI